MRKITLSLIVAATAVAGCSSNDHDNHNSNTYTFQNQPVVVPTRVAQEFYSSWGHDGRGGAALRKPAYQHVMGDEEMVMTTKGNYTELRSGKAQESVFNKALSQGAGSAVSIGLAVTPVRNTAEGMTTSAAPVATKSSIANASEEEYMRAYRKFCQGASMEMSEREWEIVALGGPKMIPASLRGKCMHSK
jgi:hypothetical protein